MCGRFALTAPAREIEALFEIDGLHDFPPRFNIAPTQPILIVMRDDGGVRPDRRAILARWGLIPAWAKDPATLPLLFNARLETAGERHAFRAALRHRRCLIPATGFYEWRKNGKGRSQPFFVRPRGGEVLAFAGLMETFLASDGSEIDTAAILTTGANATLAPIHERMPVVVPRQDFGRWLDCRDGEPRDVADLMGPAPDGLFEAIPVGEAVNKVSNMGPDVQVRVEPSRPAEDDRQGSLF